MITPELSQKTFYDAVEERTITFRTDASQSTIDSIPECEWYAVKQVLISFGYTVIETDNNSN